MAKYYVQSGPVQLIFDSPSALDAAVRAFQWSCDKQLQIDAPSPLEHVLEAERLGWQLHEDIEVNQKGFGRHDGITFDTLDVVAVWQAQETELSLESS